MYRNVMDTVKRESKEDTSPTKKRQRIECNVVEDAKEENKQSKDENTSNSGADVLDICKKLGFKPNTRFEMKWEVTNNSKVLSHWWGARLLPRDDNRFYTFKDDTINMGTETKQDRTQQLSSVTVSIRKLQYDPYPEGDYHEPSIIDVAFLTPRSLFDLDQKMTVPFRLEGSKWEPSSEECEDEGQIISTANLEQDLRSILDNVLSNVLNSCVISSKMANLTAAEQCAMADKVRETKERLLKNMLKKCEAKELDQDNLITAKFVKECMEEVALDLNGM